MGHGCHPGDSARPGPPCHGRPRRGWIPRMAWPGAKHQGPWGTMVCNHGNIMGISWRYGSFPKSWIIDIMNDHELIWGYPPNQVILEHFSIANALMIECLNMPHTPKWLF